MFLGYLSALDLSLVSEVPSFGAGSTHADIARNVLNPPIKDWQRPLIDEKWRNIRDKFSGPGELMPNPVLLAVANSEFVQVKQQSLNGQSTELFEITVDVPAGGPAPLWILDGQHRVKGMSESTQKQNPILLVLLHGDASNAYSPQQFARVFAEVTTYATPLVPLHEEWLRFAFKLGRYATSEPGSAMHWNSMDCVALLCDLQNVGPRDDANPFHDKVQLNPERQPQAAIGGGFSYNALALKDLLYDSYYALPNATLGGQALAEQIALAVLALSRNDTTT